MKKTFETFRDIDTYTQSQLQTMQPYCFNGSLSIHKYKVTIELIEEPAEVLAERLQKIWDESNTSHNYSLLTAAAKKIGYELKGSIGNKKPTI